MDGRRHPSQPESTPESTPAQNAARMRSSDPLTVSHSVIVEMVRVAALEVPGVLKVGRGGRLAWLAGSPVRANVRDGKVFVRVWIVARPGHPLAPLAAQVRQAVGATVERLLDLELGEVTVVIDGVGGWGS
jgi:uncharacterized alkaline shock family protein YloU